MSQQNNQDAINGFLQQAAAPRQPNQQMTQQQQPIQQSPMQQQQLQHPQMPQMTPQQLQMAYSKLLQMQQGAAMGLPGAQSVNPQVLQYIMQLQRQQQLQALAAQQARMTGVQQPQQVPQLTPQQQLQLQQQLQQRRQQLQMQQNIVAAPSVSSPGIAVPTASSPSPVQYPTSQTPPPPGTPGNVVTSTPIGSNMPMSPNANIAMSRRKSGATPMQQSVPLMNQPNLMNVSSPTPISNQNIFGLNASLPMGRQQVPQKPPTPVQQPPISQQPIQIPVNIQQATGRSGTITSPITISPMTPPPTVSMAPVMPQRIPVQVAPSPQPSVPVRAPSPTPMMAQRPSTPQQQYQLPPQPQSSPQQPLSPQSQTPKRKRDQATRPTEDQAAMDKKRATHKIDEDRRKALYPDYKTPFRNGDDIYSRLLVYHVFHEGSDELKKAAELTDNINKTALGLIKKKKQMQHRLEEILKKEAEKPAPTVETLFLERLLYSDEKNTFGAERTQQQAQHSSKSMLQPKREDHSGGADMLGNGTGTGGIKREEKGETTATATATTTRPEINEIPSGAHDNDQTCNTNNNDYNNNYALSGPTGVGDSNLSRGSLKSENQNPASSTNTTTTTTLVPPTPVVVVPSTTITNNNNNNNIGDITPTSATSLGIGINPFLAMDTQQQPTTITDDSDGASASSALVLPSPTEGKLMMPTDGDDNIFMDIGDYMLRDSSSSNISSSSSSSSSSWNHQLPQ